MYLWIELDDYCTVAGEQTAYDHRRKGGSAMYDSFSSGPVYFGRTLLAISGSIALAILLQLI
jgi:hypothetical protein